MHIYLSIDLDYWCEAGTPDRFFGRVFNLGLPIFVAPFHDQLVDHVNRSGCDRLLNVDYHSDLVDYRSTLSEGSWANFVEWRAAGQFEWRYPAEESIVKGFCHAYESPFEVDCSGWARVQKKCGLGGIPWRSVTAVGVCLSSGWLKQSTIGPVAERLGITRWTRMGLKDQRVNAEPFLFTAA